MSHKNLDFSQLGGLPFNQQRLDFMQQSYSESMQAIANLIGDNLIVSGCTVNGKSVGDGWVIVKGQLLPFRGGVNNLQDTILIRTISTKLQFKDAQYKAVQFDKYCEFGTGSDAIKWSDLTRLKTLKALTKQVNDNTTQIAKNTAKITEVNNNINTSINNSIKTGTWRVTMPANEPYKGFQPDADFDIENYNFIVSPADEETIQMGMIGGARVRKILGEPVISFSVYRGNVTNSDIEAVFNFIAIKKQ